MDLAIHYNYEGKLRRGGVRSYKDVYHDYCTSRAIVSPKRELRLECVDYYCRDELLVGIAQNMKQFEAENRIARLSASDRTLKFEFTNSYNKDELILSRYANVLRIAMMGETNENFSFAASPYTVRWVVKKVRDFSTMPFKKRDRVNALVGTDTLAHIRKTLNFKDWFWKLMLEADKEGISLNPSMTEAWQLKQAIPYGHMGLEQLKIQAQSYIDPSRPYGKWFPPIQLMKEK